jgi:hypothetical protein
MKKVLFATLALGMLTSCVNFQYSRTTKALAEENRQLKGFERIELLGSLDVKYEQADTFSVLVVAPPKVIDDVETRVEGNKLVVNMKGSNKIINIGVSDSEDVTVYVTSPDFLGIELRGSGDFECKKLLDTDNLDISLKGSGDIEFDDIICDQVNVSLVGSGDVELKHVKMLRSFIDLVGSGDVKINFDNSGSVESRLTGSGDITLSGSVKQYNYNVRGSGDMHANGLRVMESKTETIVK